MIIETDKTSASWNLGKTAVPKIGHVAAMTDLGTLDIIPRNRPSETHTHVIVTSCTEHCNVNMVQAI